MPAHQSSTATDEERPELPAAERLRIAVDEHRFSARVAGKAQHGSHAA